MDHAIRVMTEGTAGQACLDFVEQAMRSLQLAQKYAVEAKDAITPDQKEPIVSALKTLSMAFGSIDL